MKKEQKKEKKKKKVWFVVVVVGMVHTLTTGSSCWSLLLSPPPLLGVLRGTKEGGERVRGERGRERETRSGARHGGKRRWKTV